MTRNPLAATDGLFLTDGGLETDMIFNRGVDLPCFAAINLLRTEAGRSELVAYYRRYLDIARASRTGFVLESASWRASPDWAAPLGLSLDTLAELNRTSIEVLKDLREDYAIPTVISGCIGPRGDGYDPGRIMSAAEAQGYHQWQVDQLAAAGPDMISAITMTNVNEAIGIARAASARGLPAAVSFTVETDGRLPTGDALGAAIDHVDAATDGHVAYYMINCAHPSHFGPVLKGTEAWIGRVGGIRANASRCSHAELDAMTDLDAGNPEELGRDYAELHARLPQVRVLGGCCGTDERHLAAIAEACLAPAV